MEYFVFLKSAIYYFLKVGYISYQYLSGSNLVVQAQEYRVSHSNELNTELIDSTLPTLYYTIAISQVMCIPLCLLYFKYPKITRTYFIYGLLINCQEAFLPFSDRGPQSELLFAHLLINYLNLCTFDFLPNIIAACLYMCVFIYA